MYQYSYTDLSTGLVQYECTSYRHGLSGRWLAATSRKPRGSLPRELPGHPNGIHRACPHKKSCQSHLGDRPPHSAYIYGRVRIPPLIQVRVLVLIQYEDVGPDHGESTNAVSCASAEQPGPSTFPPCRFARRPHIAHAPARRLMRPSGRRPAFLGRLNLQKDRSPTPAPWTAPSPY